MSDVDEVVITMGITPSVREPEMPVINRVPCRNVT
jgi:hypothetical protein